MSNSFSTSNPLDPEAGFTPGSPSISQAARDLRVAAGDKAREIAHTAETKAADLKDKAITGVQNLKAAATDKAQHLKESATQQWQDGRTKAKELHVTAEDYIRQNPTKCVVSALGVGFLIGLIVRR
ncbi:MAG: DUF883 C-terminal domain-containing protein [Verrucomicrobiota bacterium]